MAGGFFLGVCARDEGVQPRENMQSTRTRRPQLTVLSGLMTFSFCLHVFSNEAVVSTCDVTVCLQR